ncbi:MAG: MptD family putative ECF transporter S component [Firmicutes bacterium]|nr:MptD family putative ECF transporter S component [Bacillota bacterium]
MFQCWTKKEVLNFLLCFAVFFVLVLATQLPGFLSPLYWAMFSVFAAFVAAGPLTCVMDRKRGFGSTAAIPLLWFLVYRCMGELGMPLMWVWIIALIVAGEILRKYIGYEKLQSIRVCVPLMSLVPMGNIAPLYLAKDAFLQRAAAEMGAGYVAGLDKYGTFGMFVLVLVLSLALATVSERISEKILKINQK